MSLGLKTEWKKVFKRLAFSRLSVVYDCPFLRKFGLWLGF